jgi:dimethylamine monooxygenase subunit A
MPFLHTPYASGKPPFSIGLAPIELDDWIEQDELLAEQLALKETILAREGAAAFDALAGSEDGQREVLELLAEHLPGHYPRVYRREGNAIRVLPGDRLIALAGEPALLTASRLVQEDLLLMRRDAEGWRLVAGSLCFPSTWVLAEKLGRDLSGIHGPAPGYAGKMADMVARIFDSLKAERPVERFNWSIYGDARLRYAQSKQDPTAALSARPASVERAYPGGAPDIAPLAAQRRHIVHGARACRSGDRFLQRCAGARTGARSARSTGGANTSAACL